MRVCVCVRVYVSARASSMWASLRLYMLRMNVPTQTYTLAIDRVVFHVNTTRTSDEALAQRIGLLPIRSTSLHNAPTDMFVPQESCSCAGASCVRCSAAFKIQVRCIPTDTICPLITSYHMETQVLGLRVRVSSAPRVMLMHSSTKLMP